MDASGPRKRTKVQLQFDDLPKKIFERLFGPGEARKSAAVNRPSSMWVSFYGPFMIELWVTDCDGAIMRMITNSNVANSTYERVDCNTDFDAMCRIFAHRIHMTELAHEIRRNNPDFRLGPEATAIFY